MTDPQAADQIFPSAVLLNSVRSAVCVELRNGVTVVGTLAKCDGWMNLVLQNVRRYSASGQQCFKSNEVCVRGNAVRSVRVEPAFVRPRDPPPAHHHHQQQQQQQGAHGHHHHHHAGARRPRDDAADGGAARPKLTADERQKKYGKSKS